MEQGTWTASLLSFVGLSACSCESTAVGTHDTEVRTTSMPEVKPAIKIISAVEVDEEIRLTVMLFSGRALILQATSLQTVADLKIEIQNKEQIPLQEQLLVFNAQPLRNTARLCDYGIGHDSSLNLVRVMPLELKIMTARAKWNIRLQPQDTVAEIKTFVNEKMSIPVEQMLFICRGKPLEDGPTLQEMGVQSGDQVALILRLKGCGQFIVETDEGDSFRVDGACADRTVADVKTAIRDRTGLAPNEQMLSYRAQVLEDSNTLEHYGIKRECKIQLTRRKQDGCRENCCFCC
ncbi:Polyubiquitin-B [Cleaved into: Ubiquitin [Durusdinium trenchii]|uniref:Polyubiquitin-B [Cleaved into: Ubiquitin n=1 Tax=Durusdinium trenchii TaxID=1381693 RepID=A0ABP0IMT0_9DINO